MTNTNKHGVDHEAPRYSQGVMMDGAAILKDGEMIAIDEIVSELNARTNDRTIELESKLKEAADFIQKLGPTIDYPIIDEIRGLLK